MPGNSEPDMLFRLSFSNKGNKKKGTGNEVSQKRRNSSQSPFCGLLIQAKELAKRVQATKFRKSGEIRVSPSQSPFCELLIQAKELAKRVQATKFRKSGEIRASPPFADWSRPLAF